MNYVIIGAGPAGVTAAETVRSVDKAGNILMISSEPEPPYSRMAIPYLLHGDIAEKGTYLRQTAGHYDDLKIDYKMAKVAGIDVVGRKVVTTDIEQIPYDRLLIATGATPIIPRFE